MYIEDVNQIKKLSLAEIREQIEIRAEAIKKTNASEGLKLYHELCELRNELNNQLIRQARPSYWAAPSLIV